MTAPDGPTLHRVTYYLGAALDVEVMALDALAAVEAADPIADALIADASDAVGHLGVHLVGPPEVAEVGEVIG
jgi:hypothetical protein